MEKQKLQVMEWPEWLNLTQASKYAGVAINTFRANFINTGRVKVYITDYGKRYNRTDIDTAYKEWI